MKTSHCPLPPAFATACLVLSLLKILPVHAAPEPLSLAGPWRLELDREDVGRQERWFARSLTQLIQLPGALQNQGYGDPVGIDTAWTGDVSKEAWLNDARYAPYRQPDNIKIPWALQPERHYVGVAWYQREITLPADWSGQRLVLHLERPHWETTVWIDDRQVGSGDSLSTPHEFDLGRDWTARPHTLTIRIDNRVRIKVGDWAHSVSDHTQGNWNGIVGRIELRRASALWLEDLRVFPNAANRSIRVEGKLANRTGVAGLGQVQLEVRPVPTEHFQPAATEPVIHDQPVTWTTQGGSFSSEIQLGEQAPLWDEFQPALHELNARLSVGGDVRSVRFGLRDVAAQDRMFLVNQRPTFLRGTLECAIFPLTGYPPTDVPAWKRIIRACQAHGLNHIRFHSWCPPEAAFTAADELGFYFHVECAAWTAVGDGEPIDAWIYAESERIVQAYGNHPSFLLMAYGNEPSGRLRDAWLSRWVAHWQAKDPRRLYTTAAGWPAIRPNQYHVIFAPRGSKGWGGGDYSKDVASFQEPVVVHEMGQWCVYPNFDEMSKYTGPLKPHNFQIARDFLEANGMLDQWKDFLHASGKLQVLCYKEEIEAALRTPGISGVQLLDLHDFPGQGTALVGILDAFWEEKGYVTPEAFRRFYNTTVPLARMEKRTWTDAEPFQANLELAHFGPEPLPDAVLSWSLSGSDGRIVAQGRTDPRRIEQGRAVDLGKIQLAPGTLPAPAAYRLQVAVNGSPFANDWTVWSYPSQPPESATDELMETTELSEAARARLAAGGKVLLSGLRLGPTHPRNSFAPIFWNRYMFRTQSAQTLGLLCDPAHPALARFPTSFHSDWQWEPLLTGSKAVVLDSLPRDLRPIVQVIDDWNTNRKLGLIFECQVGPGKLLVCAARLDGQETATEPVARQLRRSLLAYMKSEAFQPKVAVAETALVELLQFMSPSRLARLGARVVSVTSEDRANGHLAMHVLDGDPDTFWHTRWQPAPDPMPHRLVIDLGRVLRLRALATLPRQDMVNGRIKRFTLHASRTASFEGNPVLQGDWPNSDQVQTSPFPEIVEARYLQLTVESEVNGNPFAALAELDVIPE